VTILLLLLLGQPSCCVVAAQRRRRLTRIRGAYFKIRREKNGEAGTQRITLSREVHEPSAF